MVACVIEPGRERDGGERGQKALHDGLGAVEGGEECTRGSLGKRGEEKDGDGGGADPKQGASRLRLFKRACQQKQHSGSQEAGGEESPADD